MIVSTENALLARLHEVFGNTLRDIATHPGDWSEAGLRDVLLTPPSVYLVWLGAQAGQVKGVIDSRFVFYVVAEVINGAEGDRPGLYQIVTRLIAGLSGFRPGHAGPMRFEEGRNLYTEQQGQHGVVLYGTYFTCEEPVPPLLQDDGVDAYLRHYQTFTQTDGSPPFAAPITLRGENNDHE
ncbi:phage protein Gp37 [Arsenophonus sp. PmNCSU2021_1]|uniref:phage protein Gp37 n=1 Tax=Arsenophonus sp. PmNCSU2021_1 TaxID=3118989 RepID=UPI002FF33C2E